MLLDIIHAASAAGKQQREHIFSKNNENRRLPGRHIVSKMHLSARQEGQRQLESTFYADFLDQTGSYGLCSGMLGDSGYNSKPEVPGWLSRKTM